MENLALPIPGRQRSVKAIAALLAGGVSVVSGVVAVAMDVPALMTLMVSSVLLSLVLGAMARRDSRLRAGKTAGFSLLNLAVALAVIGVLIALLLPAT